MDLFDLVAKLTIDTSEYDSGIDTAEAKAGSFGDKLKGGLGTAAKVGATAVGAVAAATGAMAGAFVSGTKNLAEYGDNIDKMSQKMGMSAEAYQEWDAIMQHSGASIDSMTAAMKTMSGAAEKGNDAFAKLGITEEQMASMSQEELFGAVITGLQNMEAGTERTYIASQLLGRGATELGALLNTSAEDTEKMRQRVHELGGVMSDEAVKNAAAFQDSLQDLQTSVSGIGRGLLDDFLPSITKVMDGLTGVFTGDEGGIQMISEGITEMVDNISNAIPQILEVGGQILQALLDGILDNLPMLIDSAVMLIDQLVMALIDALPQLIAGAIKLVIELVKHLPEIIAALIAAIPEIIAAIIEAFAPIVGDFGEVFSEAWGKIKEVFANVGGWFMDKFSDAKEKAHAAFSGIKDYMSQSWELTKQVYANVGGWFKEKFTTAKENIKTIWNAVKDHLKQSWENTKEVYSVVGNWFKEKFSTAKENTVNAWSDIRERMSEIWDRIRSAFNFSDAANWGRDMIDNFIGGIREKWEALKDTLSNVAQTVRNFIGFSEPKEGPLSNFHTYAPDMMELFAKGIKDNEKLVADQMNASLSIPSAGNSVPSGSTISINVYGAQGQDEDKLAEIIMDKMTHLMERDRRVFA